MCSEAVHSSNYFRGSSALALKTRPLCLSVESRLFYSFIALSKCSIYKETIIALKAVALWVFVLISTTSLLK